MDAFRGDIFFVTKSQQAVGSEYEAGRPAIIVSNDVGNEHSEIVEVVWLTSQEKKPLPTHVSVKCKVPSTALCEQVTTISKERLQVFVRKCTDEEMAEIDKAIMVSLGLREATEKPENECLELEAERCKAELEVYKRMYENLLAKVLK